MEKENIFFAEEKKNGEEKIHFFVEERKTMEERMENIWRRKIHLLLRRRKRMKIFGEGKYNFC